MKVSGAAVVVLIALYFAVMLFAAHLFIENKSETTFVIPTAQALSNRVPAEYGFRQPRPALFLWYVRYP